MFYRELKQLQKANPDEDVVITRLDRYLSSLPPTAASNITASTVSAAIGAPREKTIGLLMAAAALGLLKLKFRVVCPDGRHGIRDYDRLNEVPEEIYCDTCDQIHQVTPDDIEYFFEPTERATSVRA